MNVSEQSMDAVAMGLDQIMADVMEIEGVMESKETVKEDPVDEADSLKILKYKWHVVSCTKPKYAVAIHKMMKDIRDARYRWLGCK